VVASMPSCRDSFRSSPPRCRRAICRTDAQPLRFGRGPRCGRGRNVSGSPRSSSSARPKSAVSGGHRRARPRTNRSGASCRPCASPRQRHAVGAGPARCPVMVVDTTPVASAPPGRAPRRAVEGPRWRTVRRDLTLSMPVPASRCSEPAGPAVSDDHDLRPAKEPWCGGSNGPVADQLVAGIRSARGRGGTAVPCECVGVIRVSACGSISAVPPLCCCGATHARRFRSSGAWKVTRWARMAHETAAARCRRGT